MKKYLWGALLVLAMLAYFVPGSALVELGLKKIALEQGFAEAAKHHSWDAVADAESVAVAQAAESPPVNGGRKAGARRR